MGNLLFNFIFMNEQNIIRKGKLFSKLYTHTHTQDEVWDLVNQATTFKRKLRVQCPVKMLTFGCLNFSTLVQL